MSDFNTHKIIIRMPNYLGDSIMALFAVELLKFHYRNVQFTFFGQAFLESLLLRQNIDYKVVIARNKRGVLKRLLSTLKLVRQLRKEQYELGVLFQNSFLNALIFKLSRIKIIIGYDKECRKVLLDFALKYDRESHYVNRFSNLVNSYLAHKFTYLPKINLYPKKLPEISFSNSKPTVGILFGGDSKNNYPHIRVPSYEKAIEFTKQIAQKKWNTVFFGDKSDRSKHSKCMSTFRETANNIIDLTGKTTVRQLIDGISSVDVLITIDSASMHIAAYVNTPMVVLLGRSSSAFDLVKPKIENAIFIKMENNMIDEAKYIENIQASEVISAVVSLLNTENKLKP